MQDVQNIPNPDVNSTVEDGEFGNHSDVENIQKDEKNTDVENIPLPPDQKPPAPVEEPPDSEKPPIDEDNPHAPQLV